MEADDLRRLWREALTKRLEASLRGDDRKYEVWTTRAARYERQAKRRGINLSETQETR